MEPDLDINTKKSQVSRYYEKKKGKCLDAIE